MPRPLRADFAGHIYHALNRGNARNKIFFKDGDFEAFERVIWEGLEKYPVDLIAYQWMSNHWHMVLSPQQDKAMPAFLGWITMTHTNVITHTIRQLVMVTYIKAFTRVFPFKTMSISTLFVAT